MIRIERFFASFTIIRKGKEKKKEQNIWIGIRLHYKFKLSISLDNYFLKKLQKCDKLPYFRIECFFPYLLSHHYFFSL